MGLIGNLAGKAAGAIIKNVAIETAVNTGLVDKTEKMLEKQTEIIASKIKPKKEGKDRFKEKQDKLMSKNPDNCHFWFKEFQDSYVSHSRVHDTSVYKIYDQNMIELYHTEAIRHDKRQIIKLYSWGGKPEIEITQRKIALRNPLAFEALSTDYEIQVHGKKLGVVKSQRGYGNLEVCFNGWKMKGNVFGTDIIEDTEGKIVAEFTEMGNISKGVYTLIDFSNPSDYAVIIALALIRNVFIKGYRKKAQYSYNG